MPSVAPGSPVTRFRSKFFGKPSAVELTESLRSVLGVDAGKLEVVLTNSVGEGVDATPAPAGKELFIRGEKHLFCISE